jgi:two-component system, LytTR family, sensor kinase
MSLAFAPLSAQVNPLRPLIEEMTGAWGTGLLLWPIIYLARRFPLDRAGWSRQVPVHLLAAAGFALAHTSFMWAARSALFPLAGMGTYDYGIMPVRYAMEAPQQLIIYGLVVAFTYLFDRHRAASQRELQAAQLQARLARAQLKNLQAQLHPHFLFNALNAISSVMYEDVRKADQLLSRLSELLRRALQATRGDEVRLADELDVLGLYLELMRARFGASLNVEVEVPEEVRGAMVPAWVLQPLVENATIHGMPAPPALARIRIRAQREGGRLVLEVEDNGPGLTNPDEPLLGRGVGLTNTAERLRGLYGDAGRLEWRNVPEDGLLVSVRLPYREGAPARTAPEELAWTASAS